MIGSSIRQKSLFKITFGAHFVRIALRRMNDQSNTTCTSNTVFHIGLSALKFFYTNSVFLNQKLTVIIYFKQHIRLISGQEYLLFIKLPDHQILIIHVVISYIKKHRCLLNSLMYTLCTEAKKGEVCSRWNIVSYLQWISTHLPQVSTGPFDLNNIWV